MTDSTIVTKELLFELQACTEAIYAIKNHNMWGRPASEILDMLDREGVDPGARDWWADQRGTEKFIRMTGSVLTMNEKFKLFNPLTGQHEEFVDINVARTRMLEIATQIFQNYAPRITTELSNEHGDATWVDTDEHLKLTAIISNES